MKNKLIVIDKGTAVALDEGQRYVLLPYRGIYINCFDDVTEGEKILCRFVCGPRSYEYECRVSIGYAPKEMGGYVGERYYILRLAQNSEK